MLFPKTDIGPVEQSNKGRGRAARCSSCGRVLPALGTHSCPEPLNAEQIICNFWAQVEKTLTCWLWKGHTNGKKGYGKFYAGGGRRHGRNIYAHRFAWILFNGPIPDGILVLHQCDNPLSVRPDHLFLGTHKVNSQDMAAKGRSHLQRASREEQLASAEHMRMFSSTWQEGQRRKNAIPENE